MTIAIIGGGAAGMMAAASARATNPEAKILLLERNNGLGKKVIISGGGRCNVTTGIHDIDILLTKYPRGNPFLKTAFIQFPPNEVYRWFEEHGVPLKTQADNRVFPQSDDGHDIVRVFNEFFAEHAVDVRLNTHVTGIEKIDGKSSSTVSFSPPVAKPIGKLVRRVTATPLHNHSVTPSLRSLQA
jgi:predicted Rossmann fold flavoprotein